MTTKPQQKRRKPPAATGALKMILAAGAVISTMIGADLLAAQDQTPVVMQVDPNATMVVVIPEMKNESFNGVNNAPISQLTIPRPIAKSKSSG